jgi:glycosyltransferase involved in cell wall biosynthesis
MRRLRCSVALCVFNGEEHLPAQVESLFNQQRLPDEIVAVDDASNDGSFARLQELAGRSPVPMRVLRNPSNLGYVRNFERAVSSTVGDVVYLCDQDDFWMPQKIAATLAIFEGDDAVMLVHSDAALVDADLRPLNESLFAALGLSRAERRAGDEWRIFQLLLKRNIITGATMAVRRTVVSRALPFPAEWVHDEWLALFAALSGKVVRIDAPLIRYRQHARNQIGAPRRGLRQRLNTLFEVAGHQRRLLARMNRLFERVATLDPAPDPACVRYAQKTLAHTEVRASLPPARWKRAPIVAGEIMNLGYFRYSRGWLSVVRDLVAPIGR